MSTSLSPSLTEVDLFTGKPIDYSNPDNYEKFFSFKEQQKLRKLYLERETQPIGNPARSCEENLFLGFFFDGTRNNYAVSETAKDKTHSNVARLFDSYPGQTIAPALLLRQKVAWPDEAKYPNYFRVYIPGVGTPFEELGDDGKRGNAVISDGGAGAAFARWGEARIVWALAQSINSVHRFFRKETLLHPSDIRELAAVVKLDARNLKARAIYVDLSRAANTKAFLSRTLQKLHVAIRTNMPDPVTRKVAKTDPAIVKEIFVSAFGFSRGAAAARAFANWFIALCELDAELSGHSGLTLGGLPVKMDFLGLFDTVASVGLASSALVSHGHDAWADSLRIPAGVACTHLVSAHEVRRSFPLDSISHHGAMNANCKEIVFPGVHSDLGGGYAPMEQGRGVDPEGADMLSRIPLAVMYREARLAGAPLKLELAPSGAKLRFKIAPSLITAFNAYLAQSKTKQAGSLKPIMREQMQYAIKWRKRWMGQMGQMPATEHALKIDTNIARADVNDMVGADKEFVEEVRQFEAWRKQPMETAEFCPNLFVCVETQRSTIPGVDPTRGREWTEIKEWWDQGAIAPALASLFENYIHDSRAWFKLTGPEAAEVEAELKKWVVTYDRLKDRGINPHNGLEPSNPMRPAQVAWVEEYKRTRKIPAMKTSGREPIELGAGYLRWRRVYDGGDDFMRLTEQQNAAVLIRA